MASDGNALERPGDYVRENRRGMFTDLVFAVTWVTLVNIIFRLIDGPTWAYYLFMLAGVLAYYGFVASLGVAEESRKGLRRGTEARRAADGGDTHTCRRPYSKP